MGISVALVFHAHGARSQVETPERPPPGEVPSNEGEPKQEEAPSEADEAERDESPENLAPARAPDDSEGEEPRPATPDEPASIRPPRALSTPVQYPEDAQRDATVILELVVDELGAVVDARVVRGASPFDTAALEATKAWRFEPALQNGEPVVARIRFEVRFVAPREEKAPVAEEPIAGEPAPADPSGPAPAGESGEYVVTVRGERVPPGGTTLGATEVEQLPGAFGDPFRAVEALPGMTPVASGVPFFFVRGAPPGNLGYLLDGVPVPSLFHGFVGPAVIHPALIDRIEVLRGGYPARYGRFAGGMVVASTKPPPARLSGRASVRVVDAGAYLSAPFASDRGHATAAGRYSYTGLILSLVTPAVVEYWDYQARAGYDLSSSDNVSVFAFGAHDFIADEDQENFAGTDFHRLDLRYDRDFGKKTHGRFAVTGGRDQSQATNGTISSRSVRGRMRLSHRMSDAAELYFGGDANYEQFRLELREIVRDDIEVLFPERDELVFGAYMDFVLSPESGVTVEPGIRTDIYRSESMTEVGVDPRISARFALSPKVRTTHSLGIIHQPPNFVPSLPGARVGGLRGGLQRAVQSAAGVEVDLPEDVTAELTLFHNLFFRLSDPLGFSRTIAPDTDTADIRALGYAIGAEVLVRRRLSRRIGGYLAYTLSRSVRSRGRLESLSAFDRTHVVSAAIGYRLGRGWRAGVRGLLFTGVPVRELTVEGARFVGQNRPPPFARLDLRLEKRWVVSETMWWSVVAEVLNATASREIIGRSCNVVRCTDEGVGPLVLPSIGVEVGF